MGSCHAHIHHYRGYGLRFQALWQPEFSQLLAKFG